MEIKKVTKSSASTNSETYHRERKRYENIPNLEQKRDTQKKIQIPTKEEVKANVELINKFFKEQKLELKYEFHEKLNEYYVTLVDTASNTKIREIPSKKMLDFDAYVKEKLGLIIDRKA